MLLEGNAFNLLDWRVESMVTAANTKKRIEKKKIRSNDKEKTPKQQPKKSQMPDRN